jgi:DNA-binding MarR family transcriptional regulator
MSRYTRTSTVDGLLHEARALSGDFDELSQAAAERVGLSPIELLAMDLISRDGSVTAGQLADHLHLTTGAITGLIDRLERSGFAKRRHDKTDRRRVLVVPTARGDRIGELFGPLSAALRQATRGYSEHELATLTEFVQRLRSAVSATSERIRDETER